MAPPEGGSIIYNPYADMHDPIESKVEWLAHNSYCVGGIIHIGANTGQELAWYVTRGYRPLLAFEPHPDAFAELKRRYGNHAQCWQLALAANNGVIDLYIPEDGDTEKSSTLRVIPTDGHDWTRVPVSHSISVDAVRFDVWASKTGTDITNFNTVVIDVQGMELDVLQGFGSLLGFVSFLIVECSKKPLFEGEASAQEVIDWLGFRGFIPLTPVEQHDDIIFKRLRD